MKKHASALYMIRSRTQISTGADVLRIFFMDRRKIRPLMRVVARMVRS